MGGMVVRKDMERELGDSPDAVIDEDTNAALGDFPVHCAYRTTPLQQPFLHSHDGFEFYLCVRGKGSFIAGDRIHALGAGTFTVVRPMALHLSKPSGDPFHRYVLAVQKRYMESLYANDEDNLSAIGPWLPEAGNASVHFRLTARQLIAAQDTMTRLEGELRNRQPGYILMIRSLLLRLFAQLGRYRTESEEERGGSDEQKRLAERLLTYLMEHHHEPLGAERLCGRFHLSRSALFRIFKRNAGVSINEFLISYRINKAKDLLRETDLPVTEVAATVGFQDISHFCRTFKRMSGMAPSRYRSSQKTASTT